MVDTNTYLERNIGQKEIWGDERRAQEKKKSIIWLLCYGNYSFWICRMNRKSGERNGLGQGFVLLSQLKFTK